MFAIEAVTTTCCETVALLDVPSGLPGEYWAVIVCRPSASTDVENDAWPPATGAGPARVVAPSLNVTVPSLAKAPPLVVTVAANVTFCPNADGLTDDDSTVVDGVRDRTLCTTTLSTSTPQLCVLRTAVHDAVKSCVYSNRSCALTPDRPGRRSFTCWKPFAFAPGCVRESPPNADRSWK